MSCLAVRNGPELRNLHCRIVLSPAAPDSSWSANLDVGQYFICRRWFSLRELDGVLLGLADGRMPLRGFDLRLVRPDGTPYQWSFFEYFRPGRETTGWPTHSLLGSGENVITVAGEDVRAALDRRLLAWSHGELGSYRQLCRFLGNPDAPFALPGNNPALLEVLVPTYCRIQSASLGLLDARLQVELSTVDHSLPIQLYAIHDSSDRPLRFSPDDFTNHGDCWRLDRTLERLEGVWDLRLMVGEDTVDETRVGIPKLSSQAHALIDPDGQWLTGLLDGAKQRRGADGFEHYVVTLLQLCGIPAVRYGFRSPDHAPDIVAELSEDAILVAECKVVPPTSEMLEVLTGRARSLASSVVAPGRLRTYLAFVHPKPQSHVPGATLRFAREHGIHIIGWEQLIALQECWQRGEPQAVLLAQLLR